MIRVCHIISGDLWAGAEVMAFHLLKGFMGYKDLELMVIILNEGRLAEEIRALNIPVEVFDERKMSFFQIFLAIKEFFKGNPTDVIHSHRYKENILAYILSKTKKDIRLIGTQHGMPEAYGDKRSLKNRLISKLNFLILSRCFQNVVAVSKDIQVALVDQYGFSKDKVKVIHNGVEIPKDIQGKDAGNPFIIGSAGRFFPVKDYPLMVEIAREVYGRTNNIQFQLAGDGPEKPKVEQLIKKYGLDSTFVLRGLLSNISGFYEGIDLYINTSLHEGIPISVLEAMSYALPVIAPSVGGLSEIIEDGIDGYLLEKRSPRAFAEKCIYLHENAILRGQIAAAAREKVVKEFSIDRMAEKYHQLYYTMK
jgi:glycosyltransferase involved in cell wall biosynthesis